MMNKLKAVLFVINNYDYGNLGSIVTRQHFTNIHGVNICMQRPYIACADTTLTVEVCQF
jgi:hypothetical protein